MRKGLVALVVLAAVLYLLLPLYQRTRVPPSTIIPYSTFVAEARQGHVAKVVVRDDSIVDGTFKNGKAFRTYVVPGDTSFVQVLLAHGAASVSLGPFSHAAGSWPSGCYLKRFVQYVAAGVRVGELDLAYSRRRQLRDCL